MRRSFEQLLRQQARSDERYRSQTTHGIEHAIDDRSAQLANLVYGCGGGRKRHSSRSVE
jgi:hypothetical protein